MYSFDFYNHYKTIIPRTCVYVNNNKLQEVDKRADNIKDCHSERSEESFCNSVLRSFAPVRMTLNSALFAHSQTP